MDGYELLEIVGKVAIVLANLIVLRIGLSGLEALRFDSLIDFIRSWAFYLRIKRDLSDPDHRS